MFKKDKIALVMVPAVMVALGLFLVTSGGEAQKALSAFVLHMSFLSDGNDGTNAPDYRFITNHKDVSIQAQKKSIVLPEALQLATENRCSYLIDKLDEAKMVEKFDAAYLIVCFDKYPSLFTTFFEDLHPKAKVDVVTTTEVKPMPVTESEQQTETETTPAPDTTEEETAL